MVSAYDLQHETYSTYFKMESFLTKIHSIAIKVAIDSVLMLTLFWFET